MSAPCVLFEDTDAIRIVTLSNPAKKNALTRAMLLELQHAATPPPHIRAVVVRGDPAGGAFSSGFDVSTIDGEERERGLDPIEGPASALETCPVPVVAALEGPCMGGALEIAMACTIRVAAHGVKLAMPPARLGLVYTSAGLARFLRAVSASRVQRMFLTGDRVDASTALAWGLVDELVAEGQAAETAAAIAARIASNAPLAVHGMLDAVRRLSKPGGATDDDKRAILQARDKTLASEDLVEGVRAFAEKRAPAFKGR